MVKQYVSVHLNYRNYGIEHIVGQIFFQYCGERTDYGRQEEPPLNDHFPYPIKMSIVNIKEGQNQAHSIDITKKIGWITGKSRM